MIELLEGEIFVPINGYEGLYKVSNMGRVKSLERTWYAGMYKGKRHHPEMLLSQDRHPEGYMCTQLTKNGKSCRKRVHKIVAEHFVDNPNNYTIVDHIDGNQSNCVATNLRFCTKRQNCSFDNIKWKNEKTSKYTGVSFSPDRNKFKAEIKINGVKKFLGRFLTEHEAHLAYQAMVPECDRLP